MDLQLICLSLCTPVPLLFASVLGLAFVVVVVVVVKFVIFVIAVIIHNIINKHV